MAVIRTYEDGIQSTMATCAHFNGISNEICNAGVSYAEVMERLDLGDKGRPVVLPCFARNKWGESEFECHKTCAKLQFPTRVEAEAKETARRERITEHLNNIASDICPTHKIAITKKQVGRCVYAEPCGCRLYQGTIPKKAIKR